MDVDGTLVTRNSTSMPSPAVTNSVIQISKQLPTGLITARSIQKAEYLTEGLNLSGISVMINGSQILDHRSGRIIGDYIINPNKVQQILSAIGDMNLEIFVQSDGDDNQYYPGFTPIESNIIWTSKTTISQFKRINNRLNNLKDIKVELGHQHSDNLYDIFITPLESGKANAFKTAISKLQVDAKNVMYIGDGINDIQVMKLCGIKVAMGNAVDELKEIADYVVSTCDNDGVAEALNIIFG